MARIKTDKDVTKKDVILNTAASLFRQRGYKASSMRDLAEKIGIEAASLYNHIRSKSELLYDICFSTAALYNEQLEAVENSKESSLKKVEEILRFLIKQMIENSDYAIVAEREWVHLDEAYLTNYQNIKHNYRKRVNHIITKGIEVGEIKPTINVPSTIWLILHAVNGIESWHRSKVKVPPHELEENMISILIDGMKKK
ncbi:TetR family transcriptional regulator [Arachidicoccus ginsenosidimutans]|uniref:TetR/AcrR family transcriptional regulator n=1 Tax=Arachidicoccus sp. BS20 TaxID=1850526 RepID=UPI0007F0A8A7|nr:TetR/AcrR family transcriptional regulator [Arachidicoccus sp. BS20]ANI89529.1 TetR family transcriptional regulator [Arachidicoccus sp. BS20]